MFRFVKSGYAVIELVVVAALVVGLGVTLYTFNNYQNLSTRASEETKLAVFTPSGSNSIVNEDGSSLQTSGDIWLGNGQSKDSSYMGLILTGDTIPQGAKVNKAELKFTQPKDSWISVSFRVGVEDSSDPASFSSSSKPSSRSLFSDTNSYSDNVQWKAGQTYSYDVTSAVQAYVNKYSGGKIALVIKGTGNPWARKFVYSGGEKPKLEVQYVVSDATVTPISTVTSSPTLSPTATATVVPTKSPTQKPTSTPAPTPSPSPTPVVTSTPVPPQSGGGSTGTIFGLVSDDILGTCSREVHDKYVTIGPDGKLYRTWHPAKDSSGCTFAHEHGDNPATANNYSGSPVPFGYIASHLGMDEPHVGFKCFVHNKGTRNDEGRTMQHDSYYCFHMGTGGPARFTARFHSLDMHLRSASGYVMNVQGMADVGNVGTICDNPRQQRTVQGFGCLLDSPYEIWENKLFIKNRGNTVASAITSTAVFDPITSMDPADKTRLIYTWDSEVQQKVFKFNDNRNYFRGCEREAYSGPVAWYNRGGSQVYYTDPYGNVVDGGVLKQEISNINTSANTGYIDQFGGLRMTEASNSQTQFKFRKSACVPGLGVKN